MSVAADVEIPGSERRPWPNASEVGALDGATTLDVSVWLRARRGDALDRKAAAQLGATLPRARRYQTRAALAVASDAEPAEFDALRAYLRECEIEVVERRWRSLRVRGSAARLSRAFGTTLRAVREESGPSFRQRTGPLHVPARLAGSVCGVFGLDGWPAVHPYAPPPRTVPAPPHPLSARTLAQAYEFPADASGRGQTVGIVAFGAPLEPDDLAASLRQDGIEPPVLARKHVDGSAPPAAAAGFTSFDVETALDAHVVAALAPGAKLVLYEAPHDERGFLDAILTALFDETERPVILSISYGRPECYWTPNALDVLDELFVAAALLGVSVFCASGDYGAVEVAGQPRVYAPASSRFAVACGGTQVEGANGARVERSWDKSGGGFSERPGGAPDWQSKASAKSRDRYGRDGRGVPDVSAQAAPPAYPIVVRGERQWSGGTSAAAPLWAALTARLNERIGTPAGFFAPLLYAKDEEARLFHRATGDGNGAYAAPADWSWNPCTGLGAPSGAALERALRGEEG